MANERNGIERMPQQGLDNHLMTSYGNRADLVRLTNEMNVSLDRHFWRWASFLLVLFLVVSITRDLRSKMWFDELFTLSMAKQAGLVEIVKATMEGCDAAPPLNAMIVHSILPIVKYEALAVRLPATIGYTAMILCLLAFCRRRMPAVHAFIACLIACNACLYYSTEGRPYGLVLGCAAAALFCWQSGTEGRGRGFALTFLALFLALMVALHYYAIFFLVPISLAEMVRRRRSGKTDWGIVAAMLPSLLTLALHYPLITASRRVQAHFWSQASFGLVAPFYREFFFSPLLYACLLVLLALALLPISTEQQTANEASMPIHEWVAIGTLSLMPFFVVGISKYTTHVFVDRYVLWAVIGFAPLASALLYRAVRRQAAIGIVLMGVLLAMIARQEIASLVRPAVLLESQGVLNELETIPDGPELILVPESHIFLELSYYAQPRLRERLVYPVNADLDLRNLGYDTDALLLLPLSHRANIHVNTMDEILAGQQRFLMAATPQHYLPWHLLADGYRVIPVRSGGPQPLLFEVEAPTKY